MQRGISCGEMTHVVCVGQGVRGCEQVSRFGSFGQSRDLHAGRDLRRGVVVQAVFGIGRGGAAVRAGKVQETAGKGCAKCKGKGGVECKGCKGTGRNKKNGNMFERWKCYDCQGFGLVKCPNCGSRGLTPEQRGER